MESPPCNQCPGACCRAYPHFQDGAALTPAEAANPLFRSHRIETRAGTLLSFKKSGKCPFLDSSTFRCRIYTDRPEACRKFSCLDIRQETNPLVKAYPVLRGWLHFPANPQ